MFYLLCSLKKHKTTKTLTNIFLQSFLNMLYKLQWPFKYPKHAQTHTHTIIRTFCVAGYANKFRTYQALLLCVISPHIIRKVSIYPYLHFYWATQLTHTHIQIYQNMLRQTDLYSKLLDFQEMWIFCLFVCLSVRLPVTVHYNQKIKITQ